MRMASPVGPDRTIFGGCEGVNTHEAARDRAARHWTISSATGTESVVALPVAMVALVRSHT